MVATTTARYEARHVFGPMNLQVRRNRFGDVTFLLGYQVLCSFASLAGYAQPPAGHRRGRQSPSCGPDPSCTAWRVSRAYCEGNEPVLVGGAACS